MRRTGAWRFICRCLAAGEDPDARRDAAAAIRAGRVGWERVVEIASEYWVTAALYWELRETGLASLLPGDVLEYFEAIYEMNSARNAGIAGHAGELAGLLNGIGVAPLLLKGAGNLVSGRYPDPGVRIMDDIDILVPEDRALECWRLLESAGYRTGAANAHLDVAVLSGQGWPYLTRTGRTGVVELHRLSEWPDMMGCPELYMDCRTLELPGGQVRVLDTTGCLMITLAHAYVSHGAGRLATAPVRSLYDAALLMRRAGGEIAWQRVIDTFGRAGQMQALSAACFLLERLLGKRPPAAIPRPRYAWAWWQRCLLNVEKPWIPLMHCRLGINLQMARKALGRTKEGKLLRRGMGTVRVPLRKLRTALRICTTRVEGSWK